MSNNKKKKKQSAFEIPDMKNFKKPGLFSNVFFYIFVVVAILLIGNSASSFTNSGDERPISEVVKAVKEDKVQNIIVSSDNIDVVLKDGTKFKSKKESTVSFDELLKNNGADLSKISGEVKVEQRTSFLDVITPLLTFGLPLFILFIIIRQMKGAGGDIMAFGKSRAKAFDKNQSKITFEDVAGNEEAKVEMKEIVDFLKFPDKYHKLGARIPKGILLEGPSGVGKTLLAKAIAGEAKVPFFSVAGSEFMEMLVGVGSARARDLFAMAKANQPSLIFIDEIDAIGRQRGMGIGGGHDEREQTLNQILIEMDGFDPRVNVIVLAATNRPDMLDPALVRPGRFDRKITIQLPDLKDREEIIKIHLRGKPVEEGTSLTDVAKKTVGFSGADIENMLNEAAILAAREGKEKITAKHIDEASLKVTMGSERRAIHTDAERKVIAYHEAGHALVSSNVADMDAVHRVSIVARGGSLGHTSFPPERDRHSESKTRLLSIIITMLGGRAAEEVVFNEITVGASDDIDRATKIAHKMVTSFGMSSLGPISYETDDGGSPWFAREYGQGKHGAEMAAKIDAEIKTIMDSCYAEAKRVLTEKKETLNKVASRLLEIETIDSDEYLKLIA